MRRLVIISCLICAFVIGVTAQDEYKKWEFYGGYSALANDNIKNETGLTELDTVLEGRETMRGFNLALTRNVHRYVGVKFDYSLHLREDEFTRPLGSGTIDSTFQNFLGGIQIKDNGEDAPRFKPFAHALAGVSFQKVDIDSPNMSTIFGIDDFHTNETSFAMAFGGGLDIKLNHKIDVRVIQLDWNIIRHGDQQAGTFTRINPLGAVGQPLIVPGYTGHNFRIGAGIVIH
jgi:opacity protein-like surface antigen